MWGAIGKSLRIRATVCDSGGMKDLARWGACAVLATRTGPVEVCSSHITAAAPERVIVAGREDLSTSPTTTNDRNKAHGASSGVPSATSEAEREWLDRRRSRPVAVRREKEKRSFATSMTVRAHFRTARNLERRAATRSVLRRASG